VAAQVRCYHDRARTRRTARKRELIDNLFQARARHAIDADRKNPSTLRSQPVALATAEDAPHADSLSRRDSSVPLPDADPEFAVLADDAFTYFPLENTELQRTARQPGAPNGFRRYRLDLQFRGVNFLGWNRAAEVRKRRMALAASTGEVSSTDEAHNVTWAGHSLDGLRSVKDAVDEALAVALDVTGIDVVASTPLETGANAHRLTCHVDIPAHLEMQPRTILQRAHLWLREKGDPLAIVSMDRAPAGFHARHSVQRRVYLYRILNRIAPPVFESDQQWHVDRFLDANLMAVAAKRELEGEKDFGVFADRRVARAVRRDGENATVRSNDEVRVDRRGDEVHIWFVGRSFLRHSIRNMVGALQQVGHGAWSSEDLRLLLARGFDSRASSRKVLPPTAPASGLTLWTVEYPEEFASQAAEDSGRPNS